MIEELAEALAQDVAEAYDPHVGKTAKERAYIGASSIGHQCERAIALRLRGFPTDPIRPALKRIFDAGHFYERLVVNHIEDVLQYFDCFELKETGTGISEQKEYRYYGNVCRAHSDGVIAVTDTGEEALVEIKSANDSSFSSFVRLGLRYAMPSYYDQMQLMMGLGEMKRGLCIVINKNTSQIHAEVIEYDEVTFGYLTARIEYIANANDDKHAKSPNNPTCSMCSYREGCWLPKPIPKEDRTCRHCRYATVPPNHYAQCQNPKVIGIPAIKTYDIALTMARTCPEFTDYREKK